MRFERQRRVITVELLVLGLVTLAVRLVFLDHTPWVDELNHVMAAESLLSDGDLSINDGLPYDRAWGFTYLVAGFIALFGESLAIARLPAVLGGTGLVLLLFLWLRHVGNQTAAWSGALLLSLSPGSIYLSQQARFYTLHALLLFLGAVATYRLLSRPRVATRKGLVMLSVALVAFTVAKHLQVTALVGVFAVGAWAFVDAGPEYLRRLVKHPRRGWIAVGISVVVVVAVAFVVQSGFLERALNRFGYADLWAADSSSEIRYYHWFLLSQYPTLWALFPLALVLAAAANSRAAIFCGVLFSIPFLVHSFAAWKAERYLFYAMPFFFGVWGLAASEFVPWIRRRLDEAVTGVLGANRRSFVPAGARILAVLGIAAFFLLGNQAFNYTARMITLPDAEWNTTPRYRGEADWERAATALSPLIESSSVVISSSDLKALYYFDRLDYILNASYLYDGEGLREQFSPEDKVARPVVSSPAAVDLIMDCYPDGLVISEEYRWGTDWSIPSATVEAVEGAATPLGLPAEMGLLAFRWGDPSTSVNASGRSRRPGADLPTDAASCRTLRRQVASASASR